MTSHVQTMAIIATTASEWRNCTAVINFVVIRLSNLSATMMVTNGECSLKTNKPPIQIFSILANALQVTKLA
jgi:hypothetical protein